MQIQHGTDDLPYPLTDISYDLFIAGAHENNIDGHIVKPVHSLRPDGKIVEITTLPKPTHHTISDQSFVAGMFLSGGQPLPYQKPSNRYNQQERQAVEGFSNISNAHLVPQFTLVNSNHLPTYNLDANNDIVGTEPTNKPTYFTLSAYQSKELKWAAKLIGYDIPQNATTQHYLEVSQQLQKDNSKLSNLAKKILKDPAGTTVTDIKILQAGISLYNQDYATKVDGAVGPRGYTNKQLESYASHTLKQTRAFLDGRPKVFAYNPKTLSIPVPLGASPSAHPQPIMQ